MIKFLTNLSLTTLAAFVAGVLGFIALDLYSFNAPLGLFVVHDSVNAAVSAAFKMAMLPTVVIFSVVGAVQVLFGEYSQSLGADPQGEN